MSRSMMICGQLFMRERSPESFEGRFRCWKITTVQVNGGKIMKQMKPDYCRPV